MFSEKKRKLLEMEKQYIHLFERYEDALSISFLSTLLHLVIDMCLERKGYEEFKDMVDCAMAREDIRKLLKDNNLYEKILRLRIDYVPKG